MADVDLNRLRLEDGEDDQEVVVPGGEEENDPPSLMLVGRFLTKKPIRIHVMNERMAGVWCPKFGVSIREAGVGIFYLQNRLWKRIQNWSGRHLSKAGRKVLVKSVAQAIPTYCMSVFLIPTSLGEELERMINSFWWGSNPGGGRDINWMSWERLSVRKEFGGMGFRHFQGFNLAMLGKQGWRIATNKDTICSRVFKAKYFSNGDFLGARLGHNPSYVWRGIHSSQVLVRAGARWKIGNGKDIGVWGEPWLRNCEDPYVKSPLIRGKKDMRVEELIDQNLKSWKSDVVDAWFALNEAQIILDIPIAHAGEVDKLTWAKSKTEEYTVRSSYHLLMEEIIDGSHLRIAGPWNKLWQAKVPQKYKLLLWRAMHNVLPTRQNLRRKGVSCPITCPHCEETGENTWHAIYWCQKAKECWEAGGLWEAMRDTVQVAEGFFEASCELLTKLNTTQLQDFFCVLWCVWRCQNDKIWKGLELSARTVVGLSRDFLHGWKKVRKGEDNSPWHISNNLDLTWWKPSPRTFTCNTNAALFGEDGMFEVGLCIRDSNRALYKAKTMWFPGTPTPKEVEAIALLEAIKWVRDDGFHNIFFELDCKAVVEDIKEDNCYNNELGSILDRCRECLKLLHNYEVSFVRRQANFVAHSLARASRLYASHQEFNSIPSCISELIMNEMT